MGVWLEQRTAGPNCRTEVGSNKVARAMLPYILKKRKTGKILAFFMYALSIFRKIYNDL